LYKKGIVIVSLSKDAMKRKIIEIDETKCNGCGLCIPNCPEGAIRLIDGKARLLGDLFCDGLGACIGECPEGAIRVTEREAAPYDEARVMANIITQGPNVIRAHLDHLQSHGETAYYNTAVAVLSERGLAVPAPEKKPAADLHQGCPGSRAIHLEKTASGGPAAGPQPSQLTNWPVQLHLLAPRAPYLRDRDLVLSADCVAFAVGDFHARYLAGNTLAIACPKLDDGQEIYLEKLKTIIDESAIRSLTIVTMEVPCCSGLARLAQDALSGATRRGLKAVWIVINLQGQEIKRAELSA
jgi:ferredoxin